MQIVETIARPITYIRIVYILDATIVLKNYGIVKNPIVIFLEGFLYLANHIYYFQLWKAIKKWTEQKEVIHSRIDATKLYVSFNFSFDLNINSQFTTKRREKKNEERLMSVNYQKSSKILGLNLAVTRENLARTFRFSL